MHIFGGNAWNYDSSGGYYQSTNRTYSTGHLIRNRKAGPGWISYLRMVVFYKLQYNKDCRIRYFPVNLSLPFLLLVFLLGVLYCSCTTAVRSPYVLSFLFFLSPGFEMSVLVAPI